MQRLVSCQASLSPSLVSTASPCDLKALCWCEKAVVVSCCPAWRPPASPIHPRAFPGGCLCVECSTPWSLEPNGVWERGLGFFSLCSAVQTCCHTAERDDSPESPLHLYFCLSACYTSVCSIYCLLRSLSVTSLSFVLPFLFLSSLLSSSLPFFLPRLLSFSSYLVLSSLISPTFFFLPSSFPFLPPLPYVFLSFFLPSPSLLFLAVFLLSFPVLLFRFPPPSFVLSSLLFVHFHPAKNWALAFLSLCSFNEG